MNEPNDNQNDPIERVLREEEPYLENDGFSQRVVDALPRGKRLTWSAKRRLVKGLMALIGTVATVAILLSGPLPPEIRKAMENPMLIAFAITSACVAIGGVCAWVMSDRA